MAPSGWQASIQAMINANERRQGRLNNDPKPHSLGRGFQVLENRNQNHQNSPNFRDEIVEERQEGLRSCVKAFGDALVRFGGRYKNVVVLDANSSKFMNTSGFALAFPDRYFNFGNSEENMISAAAGFTVRGKIPFVTSYAMFSAGRAWEQIRNSLAYPYLNVKIVGAGGGIFNGDGGGTFQALEDLAIMRAIPNMKVLCPADALETKKMVEAMMGDFGPTYLRLPVGFSPVLHNENDEWGKEVARNGYKFGKGHVYTAGTDVCIFAIGTAVAVSLQARDMLEREGISTMVVNIPSLRPIDEGLIVECAKQARQIVTVEDHQVVGGLGSAVMEVLSENYPMKVMRIGMDGFGESGKAAELYKKFGMDAEGICERIKN